MSTKFTISTNFAKAVSQLPEREQEILIRTSNIEDMPAENYETVGKDFNLTKEETQQIKESTLKTINETIKREGLQQTNYL